MIEAKWFDDVAKKLADLMPPALSNIKAETERNIKASLQGAFAKLDLVNREEFDIQTKLLAKAREQLTLLEQRVHELEQNTPKDLA